jgi:uncharacterized protein
MDRNTLSEACRNLGLFPLPGVVLMPGAVLPLHVFEPRYRQLVEDCLGGKPLCIPQIRKDQESEIAGSPALYPYASVGVIGAHHRLDNGRFNILVQPVGRVRLLAERNSSTLYRVAEAELLEDKEVDPRELARIGERVRGLFAMMLAGEATAMEGLARVPAERVAEVLAPHVLEEGEERQQFLAEDDPLRRAKRVEEVVLGLVGTRMPTVDA